MGDYAGCCCSRKKSVALAGTFASSSVPKGAVLRAVCRLLQQTDEVCEVDFHHFVRTEADLKVVAHFLSGPRCRVWGLNMEPHRDHDLCDYKKDQTLL